MAMLFIDNQWLQIDRSDVAFWSTEWQIKEREADQDIELGRFQDFDNISDMLTESE